MTNQTANSHNANLTGKIEIPDTFQRIRGYVASSNYERGKTDERVRIFNELKTIFKAKDTFKGHVYFDDLGDLIQELRQRLR